jgi:hypothetical protein
MSTTHPMRSGVLLDARVTIRLKLPVVTDLDLYVV